MLICTSPGSGAYDNSQQNGRIPQQCLAAKHSSSLMMYAAVCGTVACSRSIKTAADIAGYSNGPSECPQHPALSSIGGSSSRLCRLPNTAVFSEWRPAHWCINTVPVDFSPSFRVTRGLLDTGAWQSSSSGQVATSPSRTGAVRHEVS